MKKYIPFVLAVLAFLLPLGLYLRMLSPTYIPIDSAEFALCMKYWGICHPPGFPLYIALGHYFTNLFPFGSLIYKANLLSAFYGAVTICVVFLTLRMLKVGTYLSFLLSVLLAVSYVFWEFSIAADVFTFSTLLISLAFLAAICKKPYPAFFALGLSASHFYITAILWPIFWWYLGGNSNFKFQISNSKFFWETFIWGAVFTLGFLPQAVMFWRIGQDPAVNWGHAQGISGFWYFIRRQEFGSIFLLSNPVLTFNLLKLFKNFYTYFLEFLINFGGVLPLVAFLGAFFNFRREDKFLLISYLALVVVQLTLLSTIDPTGDNNPFQLNKFYLSTFIIGILMIGRALEYFVHKFFSGEHLHVYLLLGALIFIYFAANVRTHNYSKNVFSQQMVEDAMGQLPTGSVAITVSHVVYFGARYEQEVNGKFSGVDILYFPNEKNKDNEFYKPELFTNKVDERFFGKIATAKPLGEAEKYVLSTISRNLDRDIYILQGSFEEGFFGFLKPYIVPYGLWYRVTPDLSKKASMGGEASLFEVLRNKDVVAGTLVLKQQRHDAALYAVSYFSHGIFLASVGKYDESLEYLNKSLKVDPSAKSIESQKELIASIAKLEKEQSLDEDSVLQLGNNYFNVGNYPLCINLFEKLLGSGRQEAVIYNNLASCQAFLGKSEEARTNYEKALSLDPNLEIAKSGLLRLGN